ncbi:ubiquitin carboxyl-terminal hydrolase 4 isoform X3 [Corvus cornix cornix]|uniref:ubiquitin carboxyl-terminal hydrolase 4 isoform X3 n=1 Tax=Corvus cornix cornix TaxID=932674 RepID=UPI00194E99C8|nr:ubiquitin carboxyl-terminal hydrolase 4 isoform X3 [Corvus cornix cornix]
MAAAAAGGERARPDPAEQRAELGPLLATALRPGESWYLVESRWFKQWKKYVGFDSWDMFGAGDPNLFPGPVDNAGLFPGPIDNSGLFGDPESQSLKEHLIDELDYVLVPTEAWNKLVAWYGCIDGQQPIVRKVVEYGLFVKHYKVEVYLLELKLCESSDPNNVISCHFSKADTVATIEKEMRKLFNIPAEKETRLWNRYMSNTYEQLSKLDSTVQDAGLYQGQVVLIEVKNEDGTWPGQHCLANFSRIRAHISRVTAKTPDPAVENPEWCGEWEDMGQILKKFSDPVVCNFSPEQVQKPAEVAKYLKEKYNDNSNKKKLIAICWALAYAYRTLQQVKVEGQEDESAKPADTPVTQTAAKPDSQPKPDGGSKPLTVAPVTRKKHTTKTDCPAKDDDDDAGEGTSKPSTDSGTETITESMSIKHSLRKDCTRRSDESIISWMVRIWDAAGDDVMLDGAEVRHLGSLSRDPVIDQTMIRGADSASLWRRVLNGARDRYLCEDDLYMQQTQWKTIEQGIQCLRELGVVEIVFTDDPGLRSPDRVRVSPFMWRKLTRLGPQEYASAIAIMKPNYAASETVEDMAVKLRAYADSVHCPTHARVSAVETRMQKLEDKIENMHQELKEEIKEGLLQILAVQSRDSDTKRGRSQERRYIPRSELWDFLCDSGENMRKWGGQSTSALAARVHELKERKSQKGSSTKKEVAPVACSQTAGNDGKDDDMSDSYEGTSKMQAQGKKDNQA